MPTFQHPMRGKGFVSSRFGHSQKPQGHHGLYGGRFHPGIDIAAPLGTSVHAAAAGKVDQCGWSPGRGRHVCIRHGKGFESRYYHLSAYCVTRHQYVGAGQEIGREGTTGKSTGPHLHFEIRKNGKPLDPATYIE